MRGKLLGRLKSIGRQHRNCLNQYRLHHSDIYRAVECAKKAIEGGRQEGKGEAAAAAAAAAAADSRRKKRRLLAAAF